MKDGDRMAGARTAWIWVGIVWIVGLAPAWAERSVGVAAFERIAARGQVVPDVASRLAQRLGTRGLDKVVGPVEFGVPPAANPAPHDISGWAKDAGPNLVTHRHIPIYPGSIETLPKLHLCWKGYPPPPWG